MEAGYAALLFELPSALFAFREGVVGEFLDLLEELLARPAEIAMKGHQCFP
jgi:hypothetical protein